MLSLVSRRYLVRRLTRTLATLTRHILFSPFNPTEIQTDAISIDVKCNICNHNVMSSQLIPVADEASLHKLHTKQVLK
jgi:hypothetical protein